MKSNSICTSIGEKTYQQIVDALQEIDFAEIRIDIAEINLNEIKKLFSSNKKLVATCREGFYSTEERMERLSVAINSGAQYVDIETEADDNFRQVLIEQARAKNCKVIISYHNFENTPPQETLTRIINTCSKQGADIVKLITTAQNEQDAATILSLYNTGVANLVTFAMGQFGLISRLACIYLGAPFTYASLSDEKPLANGQMSIEKMRKICGSINPEINF